MFGKGVIKRAAAVLLTITTVLSMTACVDQHPNAADDSSTEKIVATSPAVVEICNRLNIDLAGVCSSSITETPARYSDAVKVGTAMAPDMEIVKSLNPDYVLSPSSLESDLQPKYAAIGVNALFLNLKSVEGMYASIEALGKKFNKQEEAKGLIDEFNAFMEEYRGKNEGKTAPRVLILMGLPGSYVVATENSYVGSLVALAGAENVYAGSSEEFINANTEDMKEKEPDIILRTAHAMPDSVMQMFKDEFASNDIWKHFKAVEEGRVYDLSAGKFGMSAGFDYPDALNELQTILYN